MSRDKDIAFDSRNRSEAELRTETFNRCFEETRHFRAWTENRSDRESETHWIKHALEVVFVFSNLLTQTLLPC